MPHSLSSPVNWLCNLSMDAEVLVWCNHFHHIRNYFSHMLLPNEETNSIIKTHTSIRFQDCR